MALLYPHFLDSVVAIGISDPSNPGKKIWGGTGFLFGRATGTKDDKGGGLYHVFLITNRHVIGDHKEMWVKFNPSDETPTKDLRLTAVDSEGKPLWKTHVDGKTDIAVTQLDTGYLRQNQLSYYFIENDHHVFDKKTIVEKDLTEGDPLFVLGFPMGIVADLRQHVICRAGRVARIRDYKEGRSQDILIDAFIFPGNSGGPVFTQPYTASIKGTKPIERCGLIGMVQSFLTYEDVAISAQTKKARIVFEDNTGLAPVIPSQKIIETVELFFQQPELPLLEKK
jgi:hypothetical protein